MQLKTTSRSRYNGGAAAKRQYGSSTMTEFWVYRPQDENNPKRWATVIVGGRTSGDRSTRAKIQAEPILRDLLEKQGVKL
jgi:hypothetical protein